MFEAPTSMDATENWLVAFPKLDGLVVLAKEEDAEVANKLDSNIHQAYKI